MSRRSRESEFNERCTTEHPPQLGALPGVLCARFYRGAGATQRYAAIFHFASPDVHGSAAWRGAADTPWSLRMRSNFRDFLRLDFRRYQRTK